MAPDEFRETLRRLELTQAALAHLLDLNRKTVQRWAGGETEPIPPAVVLLLRLMIRYRISPQRMERLKAGV